MLCNLLLICSIMQHTRLTSYVFTSQSMLELLQLHKEYGTLILETIEAPEVFETLQAVDSSEIPHIGNNTQYLGVRWCSSEWINWENQPL